MVCCAGGAYDTIPGHLCWIWSFAGCWDPMLRARICLGKSLKIEISHQAGTFAEPGWLKAIFLMPILFLFLIAGLWSYSVTPVPGQAGAKLDRVALDNQPTPMVRKRVYGQSFRNEKVILDGHSFVDCSFESVTFVFNGGLSEMINAHIRDSAHLSLESMNPTVQQAMKVFKGLGIVGQAVQMQEHPA